MNSIASADSFRANSANEHIYAIPAIEDLLPLNIAPDAATKNLLVATNSEKREARPFNLLRTQIVKHIANTGHRLLGVTSAAPAAGKSFMAINLALALAETGEFPVYLLDLDFRRCSVAERFDLADGKGIADWIEDPAIGLQSIGFRVEDLNLGLLPCFQRRSRTAALMNSQSMDDLFRSFRDSAQKPVLICDLPPVFANDDAMTAMRKLDAYMFIVHAGMTTRREVTEAMRLLSPSPCLGTVLNRFQGTFDDSYGYSRYDKYYAKYYED
jgi:protein-tyrosine kinase